MTPDGAASGAPRPAPRKKLSYNEQREFEQLPGRIGELEAEQESLNRPLPTLSSTGSRPKRSKQALARLDQIHGELLELYKVWDDLDSRSK